MFISGSSSNLSSSFVSLSKIQDDTEKLDFTKKGTYFGNKFRKRKPTEEDTRYTLLKKYNLIGIQSNRLNAIHYVWFQNFDPIRSNLF